MLLGFASCRSRSAAGGASLDRRVLPVVALSRPAALLEPAAKLLRRFDGEWWQGALFRAGTGTERQGTGTGGPLVVHSSRVMASGTWLGMLARDLPAWWIRRQREAHRESPGS
jgi:hypothetical protein